MLPLLERWRRHRANVSAIRALHRLGAAELSSLGIRRDQIDDFVRGCLAGEAGSAKGSAMLCHSPLCCPSPAQ